MGGRGWRKVREATDEYPTSEMRSPSILGGGSSLGRPSPPARRVGEVAPPEEEEEEEAPRRSSSRTPSSSRLGWRLLLLR